MTIDIHLQWLAALCRDLAFSLWGTKDFAMSARMAQLAAKYAKESISTDKKVLHN